MTYTLCGTPQYLSPEVILNKGHNFATDHWSLGVVIYEMIAGENPFFFDDMPQMELFESIVRERYYPLADEVSDDAFEVIDGLLRKDPTRRLGALAGRGKDIINMSWFEELDLVELRQKRFEAPFIPHNAEFEEMMKKASPVMPGRLRSSTSAPMTSMRTTSTAPQASFASLEQTFGQRASGGDLIDSSDDEL
jgi:serine/threonine protein kinase